MSKVLEVTDLSITFDTPRGNLRAVNDATITLEQGESIGVVGESGSGKTVLSRAIMGLLPGTATRTARWSHDLETVKNAWDYTLVEAPGVVDSPNLPLTLFNVLANLSWSLLSKS